MTVLQTVASGGKPLRIKQAMEGIRFGRWIVLEYDGVSAREARWICKCDCGTVRSVAGSKLRSGGSMSCGCLAEERRLAVVRTHGMTGTKEQHAWETIKQRCYNPNTRTYHKYGGAGILMCDEWLHSFETFYRDMGPAPSRSHSVDRINGKLGYSKSNCRWATKKEQARNMCTNRLITAFGKTMPACVWVEQPECVVPWATLVCRINRGWNPERSITTPSQRAKNRAA